MRIYDPRVGRFLSVDPLARDYPMLTPYQFASNTPIQAVDLDGLESYYAADGSYIGRSGPSSAIRVITNKEAIPIAKKSLQHPDWDHEWLRESYHSEEAYKNPDQAALVWAYEYNSKTDLTEISYADMPYREHKYEFGAMIGSIETKDDKGEAIVLYTIGTPKQGEFGGASVDILKSKTLPGWKRTHGTHTHTDGEEFSDRQNNFGLNGDIELAHNQKIKLYVATPKGKLKLYDPFSNSVFEIYSGVPRKSYEVVENGKFTDTHGRIRNLYKIVYKKISPPILKEEKEKK